MKKMLRVAAVVVVLACAVVITAGWDQVKRSIYELHVHNLIVDNSISIPSSLSAGTNTLATVTNAPSAGQPAWVQLSINGQDYVFMTFEQ